MARPDFVEPDFTTESDPEIIQERMMGNLPADISDMTGDFPFDFTMPTAIEISQLIQFNLVRALMIAFPDYAWDDWLDRHGEQVHITRHEATPATGTVTVVGDAGLVIEAGTVFCVPATDTQEDIEFTADSTAEMTGEEVDIQITAAEPGAASNVAAGTIVIMAIPMKGIASITNKDPVTGGTEAEDDDSLYERIHAEYEGSESYVGNDSDYIRWAKEVDGIGDCIVDPAWDGPGTVKLILVDSNGSPASQKLQQDVYNHIVSPDDRSKRLLPAGDATLTVAAAKTKGISYACTGMELSGISKEDAESRFREEVLTLYNDAKKESLLRYNDVRPVLARIDGVEDFEDFTVNGGHENIELGLDEYAATESVTFTEKGG